MLKSFRFAAIFAGVSLAMLAGAQAPPDESYQQGPDQGQVQGQGQDQPDADPPSRVARLAVISGAVSFVPAGENDWVEAQLNRPLVTGDKLWTDRNARAELEIGPATLRIDQQSSFDFLNLDDNNAQVELTQGTLNLRVRRLYDNQVYEIDTPTLAFVINRVGDYRIDVDPNGHTTIVSARQGGGDAYGEGGARFRVEEGQSITFNDPQLHDYVSNNLPRPDDFDNFTTSRDSRLEHSATRQYVAEDVIGSSDLDDNGSWSDVPEYGHVWYPTTVAVGWTPYHNGHWGWVGAYGWTWIDDASWGFAPFHYGRWAYVGNRWGWCPGEIAVRPYYAPALVAFVGGGVGISIGGPVGWFPLGPRDVWVPGYRVSQRYFTNVNIYNSRIDHGAIAGYYGSYRTGHFDYGRVNYANRGIVGATVAVPAAAFVGARSVSASAIAVNRETFANSRVNGFAAVAPTRASLVGATGAARAAPPAAVLNRNIVAASRPPAPVASFAAREAVLQKNPGQALSVHQLRTAPTGVNQTAVRTGPAAVAASGRPNVNVVTTNGLPAVQRGNAATNRAVANPTLNGNQAHTVTSGQPTTGKATVTGPNATLNTNRPVGVTTGPGQQQHLDSTRFTHSAATQNGSPAANAVQGPKAQVQTSRTINGNAAQQIQHNNNVVNGAQNQNQVNRPTAVQTYKQPTNQNVQSYKAPTNQNLQTPHTQEYRTPTTANTPAREYHAPVTNNGQQQYQKVQPVQHVQPVQQQQQIQHVQQPVQPRVVTPPVQHERAAPASHDKSKDDDKKHGGR